MLITYYRTVSRNRHDLSQRTAYSKVLHPSRDAAQRWVTYYAALGEVVTIEQARPVKAGGGPLRIG